MDPNMFRDLPPPRGFLVLLAAIVVVIAILAFGLGAWIF